MYQGFNYFGNHDDYVIRLCNPDKTEIGLLNGGYNKEVYLRFNQMSEIAITIPYQIDGVKFTYYDRVLSKKLIKVDHIGYFLITQVEESDDGLVKVKECTAYSLEVELTFKKISLFDGTYKFYDPLNPSNTLMGKILSNTQWSVGQIDVDLYNVYRTFDIPDSTIYEFLMNDVESAYECVFVFDTETRKVNAYKLNNISKNTDIILDYHNLINNIDVTELSDEIVTCLGVYGGNELGVSAVNPLGSNILYDFSYFATPEWMEQDLIDAINAWQSRVDSQQKPYSDLLVKYKDKNAEINSAKSTLENYKVERDSIEGVVKVMIQGGQSNTQAYRDKVNELNNAEAKIKSQQALIDRLTSERENINNGLKEINMALSFSNNFTEEQYERLKVFMIENTYQNDSFTITSEMTNIDVQDMAEQLYAQGKEVLSRVSQPRFEFEVDTANFLFLKEYIDFSRQLELANIVNIEKEDRLYVSPILIEIQFQLDDPTKFKLVFGNKFKQAGAEYTFKDLFQSAIKAGSSVNFDAGKWGEYVNSGMNNTVTQFIQSALDASKNNVINARNQEIVINQNGLRGQQSKADGTYDPEQVWLTNNQIAFTDDAWDTVKLALGKLEYNGQSLYGLLAETIVGKLIAGNQLQISNDKNNFILDENGAVLNNANFTVVAKNGLSQIVISPDSGIQISTRPNKNAEWVSNFFADNYGNLTLNGTINTSAGNIAGWSITKDALRNTNNGDYIGSNGSGKLSLLTWGPNSATFSGNIYARNLLDKVQFNNFSDGVNDTFDSMQNNISNLQGRVGSLEGSVNSINNTLGNKADRSWVSGNFLSKSTSTGSVLTGVNVTTTSVIKSVHWTGSGVAVTHATVVSGVSGSAGWKAYGVGKG